jgi:ABC-2 type transport system permease protein
MNLRVVYALLLKYGFVCSRNIFRAMDVFFWPLMDLLVWGFLTLYLLRVSNAVPSMITFLIGAVIMWNILYRSQHVISVSFLEDIWNRNLINIFAGPVRLREYVAAAFVMGLVQAVIVLVMLSCGATLFYSFNLFALGFVFAAFFANLLLMGLSMGLLTIGVIMRFGPPGEALAWAIPFLIQPVSAVFYPISVLPFWLQPVAKIVPASYVFEGMRQILAHKTFHSTDLLIAFGLNLLYMTIAAYAFQRFFEEARLRGLLAKHCC